jgi:hypothetical protein
MMADVDPHEVLTHLIGLAADKKCPHCGVENWKISLKEENFYSFQFSKKHEVGVDPTQMMPLALLICDNCDLVKPFVLGKLVQRMKK